MTGTRDEPPMGGRFLLAAACICYGLLVAAGWLWLWLRDQDRSIGPAALGTRQDLAASLLVGVGVGLSTSGIWALSARLGVFARLQQRLAGMIGRLTQGEILGIALSSGIGEEFFFRLAMQDALGPWPTALVFASLHVGPGVLLAWTPCAFVLGALYGWLVGGFGLLSVTLAHSLFNYCSLRRMQSA